MTWARVATMWCAVVGTVVSALASREASAQGPDQEPAAVQTRPSQKTAREAWAVQTEAQAVAKAREIVGLGTVSSPRLSAELTTLAEDNTPFLHGQLVGRPIWRVVIQGWRLQLTSAPPSDEDQYARMFDLLIDPRNGHLLKASSRWPEGVPTIAPEPSAASAEEQMPRSGLERYLGFPETPPGVSLLDALNAVLKEGEGNPLQAKQIIAHYVMQTRMDCKPRAVWAITLRGIAPLKPPPAGVSPDALNHVRNIIDANTGRFLGAGTCPQPDTGAPPATGEDPE